MAYERTRLSRVQIREALKKARSQSHAATLLATTHSALWSYVKSTNAEDIKDLWEKLTEKYESKGYGF